MENLIKITKRAKLPICLIIISLTQVALLGIIFVVESVFFGKVIDASQIGLDSVKYTIYVILAITFTEYILGIVSKFTICRGAEIGLYNLRQELSAKICNLKFEVFDNTSSGDILSRTMGDLNGVGLFWSDTFIKVFQSIFTFVTGLFVCIFISPLLTIVGFSSIPIVFYLIYRNSEAIERSSLLSRAALGNMNGLASNILSGIRTIKSFTLENIMSKKFKDSALEYIKAEKKVGLDSIKVNIIGTLISYGPNVAVIIVAGIMSIKNMITAGEYLAFTFTFAGYVGGFLYDFQKNIISFRTSESMAKRLIDVLNYSEEGKYEVIKKEEDEETIIKIKDLNFSYDDREILKFINLTIKGREKVAFVGASGSGKSTLVKLIAGMYLPKSGEITVNGFKVIEENIASIRSNIAIVNQEPFLFPSSIYKNIGYGKVNATREEIIEAAKKADIHTFIEEQKEGYNTFVGEKGLYLSGGQRQRVNIAAAFLRNPKMLILDEPTSALDSETERNIQKSLNKLMKDKATIIVAHRLSTIKRVDTIYVFNEGEIVEKGNHEELLKEKGYYFNLYMKQFEEVGEVLKNEK
jgi:ABC-type multidrug transport system fused ATPase/permease subunit